MNYIHLLAIFAHPDDEAFRCRGTLALLTAHGVHVHILTFTCGQVGSCGQPPVYTREDLGIVRAEELRCSCQALGLDDPQVLDYEDGRLQESRAKTMIEHILSVVESVKPQVLLSFGPDGLYSHPDHIAVGEWTAEAFRCAEEVAALYTLAVPRSLAEKMNMRQVHPVPDEDIALTVDVSPVWQTKMAAMRCHATQVSSSPIMSAPADRQRLFFGREHFVRAAVHHPADDFLPDVLKGYIR